MGNLLIESWQKNGTGVEIHVPGFSRVFILTEAVLQGKRGGDMPVYVITDKATEVVLILNITVSTALLALQYFLNRLEDSELSDYIKVRQGEYPVK